MSPPFFARSDEQGDRFYLWKAEAYWSVTTMIGGGVPKHLVSWAAKSVADLVYADLTSHGPHSRSRAAIRRWARLGLEDIRTRQAAGELKSIVPAKLSTADLALRWIKGEPTRIRDLAADIGSDVHDEAERHVLDLALETGPAVAAGRRFEPWPERLRGWEDSFRRFLDEWEPEYLATEATVYNRAQAYAGTLDAIMRVRLPDGRVLTLIVDYKSGRSVHAEVALQLAAYSRAEFVGHRDGETESPLPPIEAAAVLHIRPTGYTFRLVRNDEAVYRAFLHAREVYRWQKEIAGTVLLQILAQPKEGAA